MTGKTGGDSLPKPKGPGVAKVPGKSAKTPTPGQGLNTGVDTGAIKPGKTGKRFPAGP